MAIALLTMGVYLVLVVIVSMVTLSRLIVAAATALGIVAVAMLTLDAGLHRVPSSCPDWCW